MLAMTTFQWILVIEVGIIALFPVITRLK